MGLFVGFANTREFDDRALPRATPDDGAYCILPDRISTVTRRGNGKQEEGRIESGNQWDKETEGARGSDVELTSYR